MFTQSRIAIICSAPILNPSYIKKKIKSFSALIAVDKGANHCHSMGLQPDLIVGDMDSVDPQILQAFHKIPLKRFPKDKDKTDSEIAIELALHPHIEEICLFGALGGRTDHTIGNLILLTRFPEQVFIESEEERLFAIRNHAEISVTPGQTISLIPLNGPVTGITTEGLKWALKNSTLDKQFISLSNESTDTKIRITVQKGDLLCCINTVL